MLEILTRGCRGTAHLAFYSLSRLLRFSTSKRLTKCRILSFKMVEGTSIASLTSKAASAVRMIVLNKVYKILYKVEYNIKREIH